MARKVGRPSDYTEELLEKARDYVENYKSYGDPVPTVAGLCVEIGIHKSTAFDWAKQESKQEFSYLLRDIESEQERMLVKGGLADIFNMSITKMMLTKHGYSDKVEQNLTSSDGSMSPNIQINFVDPPTEPKENE